MSDYLTKKLPFHMEEEVSEEGVFSGYASTFGGKPDSYNDIIAFGAYADTIRKGGKHGLGVAMLYQHEMHRPVGLWNELVENKKGLKVSGQLAVKSTDGKDTYIFMKMGILKAMSIGWEFLKFDSEGLPVSMDEAMSFDDKTKIRTLKRIDLWEISPVMFPANTNARITRVKIDDVKTAIEDARTVRELEGALIESGLSNSASKYVVSLCKDKLGVENTDSNKLKDMLACLESARREIFVMSIISNAFSSFNLRDVDSEEEGTADRIEQGTGGN